jgi:S-adenosylmethionine decarboxylase
MNFEGRHLILNLEGCTIPDNKTLKDELISAVESTGATILSISDYAFTPFGYTCVILISESHASIHTFPEHKACFIDYFTCGNVKTELFESNIVSFLNPSNVSKTLILRD